MPKRIQRKRTKGWRMPDNTVFVGRPGKWGNPFIVGTEMISGISILPLTAEEAVQFYRDMLPKRPELDVTELRGKNLSCWCRLDQPCHADVLLKLANR